MTGLDREASEAAMYVRFIRLQVREGAEAGFSSFYRERIVPALERVDGCLFAGLLRPWRGDEHRSLTIWRSAEAAKSYEESGLYAELLRESAAYLVERAVWRLRLAESDSGSADAMRRAIPPEGFEVEAGDAERSIDDPGGSLFLRLVSVRVAPGCEAEFARLYREEALPAQLIFEGCRGAFLVESAGRPEEMLAISVWDREEHAARYEASETSERLTHRLEPLFSPLYDWRATLSDGARKRSPLEVETYHLVQGRRLHAPPPD